MRRSTYTSAARLGAAALCWVAVPALGQAQAPPPVEDRAAQEEPPHERHELLEGAAELQKLNPELTFSAGFLVTAIIDEMRFYAGEDDRSSLAVREVGLHFQRVLDPYSMFKSALAVGPEHGLELEEVYVSWLGVIPALTITAGRFRQGFGVLNRWHGHDLDQTSYPLALELVLGEDGLTGNGLGFRWLMPSLWAHANELTLEVVDGDDPTLFAGEHFSVPSSLLHLVSHYDLSDGICLELGLTGMLGFNNRRGLAAADGELVDEPWRRTYVAGADLTLSSNRPRRGRHSSFIWRTEAYAVQKELPAGGAADRRRSWGIYSYLQYQLAAPWFLGLRGDYALPTLRASDERTWDLVPYITFWQSEFVYLRLEYRHGESIPFLRPDGGQELRTDDRVLLQLDFAAGPHKHDKY